jgi:predicted secreted protein
MDPLMGIAIYIVLWWLSLFMVLPLGVKSLKEGGVQDAAGHDAGAPVAPDLKRKALWACAVAAVLWIITYVVLDQIYFSQFR